MKTKKAIFVIFIVLIELAFITAMTVYSIKFNNQNEQIFYILLSLIVSGFIGPMFFLPTYLLSEEPYSLPTALVNYSMMLMESATMLLGLALYGNAVGSYGETYILLIYVFFGFHLFSYPKKFSKSLVQFVIPVGYMALNIVKLKFFSTIALNSLDIVYNSLFNNGYIFTWGLVIGGFLVFCKFWYMSQHQDKYKQELEGVNNVKTLYIPLILYSVFIFIPGVWYMSHGFENFFELKDSLLFDLISIAYFIYLIWTQGQNFSNQLGKFLSGKTQKKREII